MTLAACRARLVGQALALRDANDLEGLVALLSAVPPADLPPGLVPPFSNAALELRDEAAIAGAVAASVAATLQPRIRAVVAWRFAYAGRAAEAWRVLHADPALLDAAEARDVVLQLLGMIADAQGAPPGLRQSARSLHRGLAGTPAEAPHHPAPFAYPPGAAGPRRGGSRAAIAAAPGLRAEALAAFVAQADAFEAKLQAGGAAPQVTACHEVFVNRRGQVWQPDGQVLRGTNLPLPDASRAAMAGAPRIDAAVYAIEQFDNIFHWVADTLPGIAWRFAPGVPSLPLVLQPGAAAFKAESLAVLAGGGPPPVVEAADALFVGRLYSGTFGADSLAPEGAHRAMIEAVAAAADAAPTPADGPARRLYISRRDATKRPMGNEAALEELLAARGFGIRRFSGRGFLEQVRLVREAQAIVAPHGAALGLLPFARPGTRVFEIVPASSQAAGLRFCMARLSRLFALPHRLWLEPANPLTGGWTASLDPLLADLDAWLR